MHEEKPASRDERLKAALRANLRRRKAQERGRATRKSRIRTETTGRRSGTRRLHSRQTVPIPTNPGYSSAAKPGRLRPLTNFGPPPAGGSGHNHGSYPHHRRRAALNGVIPISGAKNAPCR